MMGGPQPPAAMLAADGEAAGRAGAERGHAGRAVPVIVLTCAHAGAWRLQWLLSGRTGLACTSSQFPSPLLAQVNDLLVRLDYPLPEPVP
jgi:hypothetical protein